MDGLRSVGVRVGLGAIFPTDGQTIIVSSPAWLVGLVLMLEALRHAHVARSRTLIHMAWLALLIAVLAFAISVYASEIVVRPSP